VDADDAYLPIKALNMTNNDWILLAKVTSKGDIKKYNTDKGPGQLFNFELTDSHGGQIQATAFGDAVDFWYPKIDIGKIYKVSSCFVKIANKRYSSIKNDY